MGFLRKNLSLILVCAVLYPCLDLSFNMIRVGYQVQQRDTTTLVSHLASEISVGIILSVLAALFNNNSFALAFSGLGFAF
jgi:hypothetical protein